MTRCGVRPGGAAATAVAALISLLSAAGAATGGEAALPLVQGDAVSLGGRRCVLTRLDALPYVEDEYTRRFRFDRHDNPKLAALRERCRLDEVVAPGGDEFDRQVLLLDWVNHRLGRFGRPTSDARGALRVLAAADEGHTFFCAHYADVLVSAAASLGWVTRPLALRRPDHVGAGSTEHAATEMWSNQFRRWVLFDPTFAMYVERRAGGGPPLNAFELRQEWFGRGGRDLVFVLDKARRRHRASDLPVFRGRHAGFGDLSLDASALNVYAFIGYVPNTNLMDGGLDYAKMFITRDDLCDGTTWHQRPAPAAPASDPYFPINQAALSLRAGAEGAGVQVNVRSLTPNFKTFLARVDGGDWRPVGAVFGWWPRAGRNRLEVKAVNEFGVEGPISTAEVTMAAADH